jgi:hypothetical protein
MNEEHDFQLGQKVVIGGRTMLSPTISLVGLTGRIISSRHDAPPGTVAVLVDWDESEYADVEDLPDTVNVPSQFVEIFDPNKKDEPPPPPKTPFGKPKLHLT